MAEFREHMPEQIHRTTSVEDSVSTNVPMTLARNPTMISERQQDQFQPSLSGPD